MFKGMIIYILQLLSAVSLYIDRQRLRYEMLGSSWALPYQPIGTLPASDALGIPLKPQYFIPCVSGSCFFVHLNQIAITSMFLPSKYMRLFRIIHVKRNSSNI